MSSLIQNALQKIHSKILSEKELSLLLKDWRALGQKVVFTNGCFDILHKGHIEYLAAAASMGERLVIGLNTDESVRRQNKGPGRPVNDQEARALLLAALAFTDVIVLFNEDTPERLISTIMPDVLVKGGDYKPEEISGYKAVTDNGGIVTTIPLTSGFSTTALIRKLKDENG